MNKNVTLPTWLWTVMMVMAVAQITVSCLPSKTEDRNACSESEARVEALERALCAHIMATLDSEQAFLECLTDSEEAAAGRREISDHALRVTEETRVKLANLLQ